jgi:hypothetical protein
MKTIPLVLIVVSLISSCGLSDAGAPISTPAQVPEMLLVTGTPVCISLAPTEADTARALSFTGDILETDAWEQTYAVSEGSVSVTWQNIPQNAAIFLAALIFPCGYDEPDLDRYFNDENWDTTFSNYASYELIDQCNTEDGLRLHQFEAASQGFDYDIRYWVFNDTDTRVITAMMAFPSGSESLLDDYASRLFPELTTCH